MAPLSIGKLPGVGQKTEPVLRGMGITTIGQLAKMSPEILKKRFGVFGMTLYRFANGQDNREVSPRGETSSISREITFARDTGERNFLSAKLRYLAEKVGADLRQQGKQARSITVKVRYADFTTITRSQTSSQAIDTDETIFQSGDSLLSQALMAERKKIRLIGIEVSNLSEMGQQLSLLDNTEQRREKLDRAVDRIRNKYGFSAIQTGRTLWLKDIFSDSHEDESPQATNRYKVTSQKQFNRDFPKS